MSCVWAARFLSAAKGRRLLGSFVHGSMANSLPQAIGAQAACPGRQVIALSGDGGFICRTRLPGAAFSRNDFSASFLTSGNPAVFVDREDWATLRDLPRVARGPHFHVGGGLGSARCFRRHTGMPVRIEF